MLIFCKKSLLYIDGLTFALRMYFPMISRSEKRQSVSMIWTLMPRLYLTKKTAYLAGDGSGIADD